MCRRRVYSLPMLPEDAKGVPVLSSPTARVSGFYLSDKDVSTNWYYQIISRELQCKLTPTNNKIKQFLNITKH